MAGPGSQRPWAGRCGGEGVSVCVYVFLTSLCTNGGPCVHMHQWSHLLVRGSNNTRKRGTGQAPQGQVLAFPGLPARREGKAKSASTAGSSQITQGFIVACLAWCSPLPGNTQARKGSRPRRSPGLHSRLWDRPARKGGGREGRALSLGARPWRRAGWGMEWEVGGTGPARRGTRRRSRGAARSRGPTRSRRPRPAPRSSRARRRWAGWG